MVAPGNAISMLLLRVLSWTGAGSITASLPDIVGVVASRQPNLDASDDGVEGVELRTTPEQSRGDLSPRSGPLRAGIFHL